VAWFLCAVHRIMAPRSTSFAQYPQDDLDNGPLEQLSAMPPWFRDIRPDDPEGWNECILPELHNQEALPLAYWDGLFYALIAEIQYLYKDLHLRFGARFELGNKILHNHGRDTRTKEPFSAVEFARLLETCWEKITCPYLTVALDYAIMQRAFFLRNGKTQTLYNMTGLQGLLDVSSMDPIQIVRWLSEKHATEVKVAVRSNAPNIPGLLSAYDAVRARREVIKERQKTERALTGAQSESSGEETRTNTPVPQKRLLPDLTVSPVDTDSQYSGTERQMPQRGRLAHKPSNLAYVANRDYTPANLYRDHSGQRYPQEATRPRGESSATSPPIHEPLYHAYTTPDIPRKPLPLTTADDQGLYMKETHGSGPRAKASTNTKPSTQEHTSPETQPTSYVHASFDNATHNQSFNLSERTQSFPDFDDTHPLPSFSQEQHYQAGQQAQDDEHPTLRAKTRITRARPSTSPTPPSPDIFTAPRSNTLPTGSSPFGMHDQIEPVPRLPTNPQRYVSAGGHTPLHQRDIMEDFQLPTAFAENEEPETFSMNKDDFFANLEIKNQLEDMTRVGGALKASKASRASTNTSEKKEKSFRERVRQFSRKSSKAADNDQ
jgi:hypothetical protein